MLVVLVIAVLVLASVAWARYGDRGPLRIRSCCGARPWPPDDISAREPGR